MKKGFVLALLLIMVTSATSQSKKTGPIIKDYGAVWSVDNVDYLTNTDIEFKAVFDIMHSPENPNQLNSSIETAARFLNMHGQKGIPTENLKVVMVVHNKASKDIITNSAYNKRFGIDNPNSEMVQQLLEAGVEFIFCGQSSLSRNFPKVELIPGVQLGLSAMTALIQKQNEGYRLIKF